MHEFVHGMLMDRTGNGFLGFAHNGGDSFAVINMDPGSKAPDRLLIAPFIPDVPRRCDSCEIDVAMPCELAANVGDDAFDGKPASRYVNWVLTMGFAPGELGWKEPVATGRRSPRRKVAFRLAAGVIE
jgi:hypothetical protein